MTSVECSEGDSFKGTDINRIKEKEIKTKKIETKRTETKRKR